MQVRMITYHKPIKPRVLLSRIKALLRRTEAKANSVSNVELEIDTGKIRCNT